MPAMDKSQRPLPTPHPLAYEPHSQPPIAPNQLTDGHTASPPLDLNARESAVPHTGSSRH